MTNIDDWFKQFIDDCCVLSNEVEEQSANLYTAYINYCFEKLIDVKNTTAFYKELGKMNLKRISHKRIKYFKGIKLNEHAYNLYITLGEIEWAKKKR